MSDRGPVQVTGNLKRLRRTRDSDRDSPGLGTRPGDTTTELIRRYALIPRPPPGQAVTRPAGARAAPGPRRPRRLSHTGPTLESIAGVKVQAFMRLGSPVLSRFLYVTSDSEHGQRTYPRPVTVAAGRSGSNGPRRNIHTSTKHADIICA